MATYLTVREVAAQVRRSVKTIYRWIEEGLFPNHRKVKGGYLVPLADVERLLTVQDPPSPPPPPQTRRGGSGFARRWRQ